MHKKPIFFDPTGRRAHRVSRLALLAGVVSTLLVLACAVSLFVVPKMADLPLEGPAHSLHALAGVAPKAPRFLKPAARLAAEVRKRQSLLQAVRSSPGTVRTPRAASLRKPDGRSLAIGFYVNWDDNSYPALKRALAATGLDESRLDVASAARTWRCRSSIDRSAHGPGAPARSRPCRSCRCCRTAWTGTPGMARAGTLLADPVRRRARIAQLVGLLAAYHFQGVTVDFEERARLGPERPENVPRRTVGRISPHGWGIVLSVPFDDAELALRGDARRSTSSC